MIAGGLVLSNWKTPRNAKKKNNSLKKDADKETNKLPIAQAKIKY